MCAQCNIPEHKLHEERREDICKHRKKKKNEYAHLRMANIQYILRKKNTGEKKTEEQREGKTGACAVSFDRGPL